MNTLLHLRFFFVLLFFVSFTFSVTAQTPPSNLSGVALRTWFKQNYHTGKHTTLGYSTARRYMYNNIDNKNNSITCVYSGFVQPWTYGGTGTNPMPINCEHTVPQSFFGEAEPMVSDLHHLFPTYSNWNSTRSNYPFADINDSQTEKWMYNSSSQTSVPSSSINAYSEYANQKFEPREDQKGNTARAIFYFYTMYPTQAGSMSQIGDINVLYQWHLQDPVDAAEIARNNKIQQYQGDRNPYIDYPQSVAIAWNLSGGNTGGGTTGGGTTPPTTTTSDLFISEYIEGSSNNKAIEIYNPTSSSVNLSSYSIQKQSNGAGSWNSTLSLSGTLAAGQTYTIVYSYATTTLANKGNLVTTSNALTFNGNDAVGLFKNGSLIDIVGVFNSITTFGANVTLVRKPTVTTGKTIYTISEWTSYPSDTFTYTGSHTINGATTGGGTAGGSTSAPTSYCSSKGNSVADEWINRVTFGSINNTSGSNGGYKDYTNLSTAVSKGSSQTITIYPSWSGNIYNEAYTVWIDWNRDGDFNDSNEMVYSRSATNLSSVSGTISVPATASTGTTRMRVSMKYNANATACETFSYGEVEDYHITITGTSKIAVTNNNKKEEVTIQNTVNQFNVFPNPTSQDAKLRLSVIEAQNVVVRMFDAQGKEVWFHNVFVDGKAEINLPTTNLKTGLYIVEIIGNNFRFTNRVVKN